ncbi:MAG TPA: hypothetical protein VFJ18_03980 [Pararhizobium sp.]|nr:hypothetical protein [Pararhizobium sp.]
MPVSLDPHHQLDLAARKLLAARLLRLSRTARFERDLLFEEEEKDGAAEAALLAPEFAAICDLQIARCYEHDTRGQEERSLIAFLEEVARNIAEASAHVDGDSACAARKALRTDARRLFDCRKCGRPGLVCNDVVDIEMMSDPKGGRCLGFLTGMVEAFAKAAEGCYKELLGRNAACGMVPPIVLETFRMSRGHGSLPVDGEFEQTANRPQALLRIYWPMDETLDEAIKSLPYVVFHEVFVHAAQGAALKGPRFKVKETCAFTEGAVDAAGYDLLRDRVLTLPRLLPKPLEDFHVQMEEACREYHNKRFAKETTPPGALPAPGWEIRDARRRGRSHVYLLLKQIGREANRDRDWPGRVILMLNLCLDRQQRLDIYKLFHRAGERRTSRQRLADSLDTLLLAPDAAALIGAMRKLV